jgi:ParB-like chromosome segregation protein Spo0J
MAGEKNVTQQWPADAVERRKVSDLTPYARNARKHSDKQIEQIVASIKQWGWTIPILVDEDGTIIAGHGRLMAANKMGLDDVPVMVARGWTQAQKHSYVLADNQIATNAGWDQELLALELADLKQADFDLTVLGFSDREINRSLQSLLPETADSILSEDLQFRVVVDCASEDQQAELLSRLEAEGLKCRALIS